jgi:hypothetical protein
VFRPFRVASISADASACGGERRISRGGVESEAALKVRPRSTYNRITDFGEAYRHVCFCGANNGLRSILRCHAGPALSAAG